MYTIQQDFRCTKTVFNELKNNSLLTCHNSFIDTINSENYDNIRKKNATANVVPWIPTELPHT